jgi:lysophospholipase L1-like esterase
VKLIAVGILGLCCFAQTQEELQRVVTAQRRLLTDWGGLTHYGSDNAELGPPKPGENRVVFLGDEITEKWGEGKAPFFPGKPYINRGITRQASPQMLVRFRQDVIALKPKVVVIQAGLNDLAGVAGPATEGTMSDHFISMVELAKLNGIRVVLASLTPICDCYTNQTARRPQGRILGMNGWLKGYAARSGSVYLDYYSALAEGRNMKKEYTVDGLLPNDAGYELMAPLAEKAIAAALK